MDLTRRMPAIDNSRFATVPGNQIPRSTFITSHSHKTTFNAGRLVPIHVDEVLPGDVHNGRVTILARIGPNVFPVMDALYLETFFFFVPARLTWENFVKMMGERRNPSDSISYTVPQMESDVDGYPIGSLGDYFGLGTIGQITVGQKSIHNAMPVRAYFLIYNDWFRDQNLQNSYDIPLDDGPDTGWADIEPLRRNKKHDYFTGALPWTQKGDAVALTFAGSGQVPISGLAINAANDPTDGNPAGVQQTPDLASPSGWAGYFNANTHNIIVRAEGTGVGAKPLIYAEMGEGEAITINALRLAIATQSFLEKDARGGTRYTELVVNHFRVRNQDMRLQRPEYIGGGRVQVQTQAIPQTSATGLTGGTSALGALGANSMATDQHSFQYAATEHGYIIGLAWVGAELTYQQGLRKMWSRLTRYDFPWPTFANIGEQAILTKELYHTGDTAIDNDVFGYTERYAEMKYRPSMITGRFRSTAATPLDSWHLSQKFTAQPLLNSAFIQDTPPLNRMLSAGSSAGTLFQEILFDSVFTIKTTRALPMFSIPGLGGRF